MTSQSHISTAHSISLTGAKPIFVDCNSLNGTIDADKIENHKKNQSNISCASSWQSMRYD